MTNKFIPYACQSINEDDRHAVNEALASAVITRGSYVEDFEKAIASYCGAEYAVAFNSGTSALLATGYAANLGPYDFLITTPNTFVASASVGISRQATPIFVDIDRDTGNFNLDQVAFTLDEYHSSRGKIAIVPVHFSGIAIDMQRLEMLNRKPNSVVIEDAAHALGSYYPNGKRVGCCEWSQMTVFSFHPAKTITTGEGGIVTTNDPELFQRLRLFRNNGIERTPSLWNHKDATFDGYYEIVDVTGNYNVTDFQAALGLSQLQRIDQFIAKRHELVKTYRHLLRDTPYIQLFTDKYDAHTAFHLFVVQIDFDYYNTSRAFVVSQLQSYGIGTQVHYIPMYKHPFFMRQSGDISAFFPNMEGYYAQALSLPLYYDLSIQDVEYVVSSLMDILTKELNKKNQKNGRGKRVNRA